jgi:hypothetical protein
LCHRIVQNEVVNLAPENIKNRFWWKIKIIKICMVYKVVPIVTTMLPGDEFELFGLTLVIML